MPIIARVVLKSIATNLNPVGQANTSYSPISLAVPGLFVRVPIHESQSGPHLTFGRAQAPAKKVRLSLVPWLLLVP